MSTQPLLSEVERAFPVRPFTIELWDGSKLPSTDGGGPTFRARSPNALAYAVAAPGQLGLGRAYVSGEIEVDDMEAVIGLLNDWKPPPVGAAESTPPSATGRPSATTTTWATSSSRSSSTRR
jgi:cyclopropane-fatty-acyl-phospholipid synthase